MNLSAQAAARLRRWAGASRCPVVILAGGSAPVAAGDRGHAEFKNGHPCASWYGARRAGYKARYLRSTYRVEVGDVWLAWHGFGTAFLAERVGLVPDVPPGILGDWLQEFCPELGALASSATGCKSSAPSWAPSAFTFRPASARPADATPRIAKGRRQGAVPAATDDHARRSRAAGRKEAERSFLEGNLR